jgi:hypothetical protein
MIGEYQIFTSQMFWEDVDAIKEEIVTYSNFDDADNWESGLFDTIRSLKTTAGYQICEFETEEAGFPVRKVLYRQKEVNRQYHLFFTISLEEYPMPLGGLTTAIPDLFGMVKIFAVRHASRRPMTGKELRRRFSEMEGES